MDVSIGICTWNRADLLDQTLEHMRHLHVPSEVSWEILVVNNCCTDRTDTVIAAHASALPIRRIYEPRQGKSHALNTATEQARGELILWTDDDVLVDPRWLAEMVVAARAYPEHSFFGGPIDPWFAHPAPGWLADNWPLVSNAFATRDFGPETLEFTPDALPFGANFAIRTAAQRRFEYHTSLGRVGASEVRGEEIQLLVEMLAAGERGRWIPQARVQHYIPPERIGLDYLVRFYHGIGQTQCRRDALRGKPIGQRDLRRKRRRALRRWVGSTLSRAIPIHGSGWLKQRLEAARDRGYYEAGLAMLKEPNVPAAA
ncbi:MAG: glycosyltransferase [Pirellulaceae bacterium]